MLNWFKQWFANANQNSSPEQNKNYDVDDWLVKSAEASNFKDGLLGNYVDSLYWYMRASETAPDYEKPVLSTESKARLRYDYICAYENEFEHTYNVNEDITIKTESSGKDSKLKISILITDFEKWASGSRLYQYTEFEILGLAGKYYVDLLSDIRDSLNITHLWITAENERQEYTSEVHISGKQVEQLLDTVGSLSQL